MMNLRGLIICDEERNKKKKNKIEDYCHPYLPEELILENIIIRLSARDLAKWSCVSKYLYKSILHDSRFASSHFDQNKNKLNLVFNLLNVWICGRSKAYFLSIEEKEEGEEEEKDNGFLLNYRLLMDITSMTSDELVGYCNGLVCTKQVGNASADCGQVTIVNPTRREMLTLNYSIPTSSIHLCHGFCFDSLLQQYKAVFIYTTTSAITGDQEFICMVLTFGSGGTNNTFSWRKIVTSTAEISPPPGSTCPFPGRMVTRSSRISRRSATLCGVDLLWRITNCISDNDSKTDMLLSFDIHDEKIRFIRLPDECSLTRTATTTRNEHQCLVIDHHLLYFKGYPCVARSEKIMIRRNRHHRHHRHRRHPRKGQRSSFCCCGFKVHLFVLEDKVNQVWIKEETFHLQIKEEGLLPAPFCCYFDTTTTATSLPTRILSFSDQLLLYWTDGEYLLLYNLQMKYLKVVKCIGRKMNGIDGDVFETKMKKGIRPGRTIGDDDNFNFPYMDYQLHAQAENILSLKSFIPEGKETRKFCSHWDFQQSMKNGENKEPAGLLCTPRELVRYHAFY